MMETCLIFFRFFPSVTLILFSIADTVCSCTFAEEGKPYSFTGAFSHSIEDKMETLWLKNKSPTATCSADSACFSLSSSIHVMQVKLDNRTYAFNLTVTQISRREQVVWTLKYISTASLNYPRPLYVCVLKVFAKGSNVSCNEFVKGENWLIFCHIFNIYPQANGFLTVNDFNSTNRTISMNCSSENTSSSPEYFNANCSARIPKKTWSLYGGSSVVVSLYPNISNNLEDQQYGQYVTVSLPKEEFYLGLHNCQDLVEENYPVRCLCVNKTKLHQKEIFGWVKSDGDEIGNGDHYLSFVAKIPISEHICRLKLDMEDISSVKYQPKVFSKGLSIQCDLNNDAEARTMECKVEKIYPQGICSFQLNKVEDTVYSSGVKEVTTENDKTSNYYRTICSFKIPTIKSVSDINKITVFVYPNISGEVMDKRYSISFVYNITDKGISSNADDTQNSVMKVELFGPIFLSIVIFFLIVVMLCICFIFRRKNTEYPSCINIPLCKKRTHTIQSEADHVYEQLTGTDFSNKGIPLNVAQRLLQNETFTNQSETTDFTEKYYSNVTDDGNYVNNHVMLVVPIRCSKSVDTEYITPK